VQTHPTLGLLRCPLRELPHEETSSSEIRTWIVIGLTFSMMIAELTAGTMFNSMALLADGWHMSTHVAAFLVTALAYWLSRKLARDHSFTFGTGKIRVLGGFASAVLLAVVALMMASESAERLIHPKSIRFDEAIVVAVLGLLVNLISAFLLKDDHSHSHSHGHHHLHHHGHSHDLNRRAAYLHVLADALTSLTAIVALVAGKFFGWGWMDPLMGIVGSLVVASWSYGLLRDTGGILLDRTPTSTPLLEKIKNATISTGDQLTDLHLWQVAEGRYAAILTVESPGPSTPQTYRDKLSTQKDLIHLTVEINAPQG
jgi:cation diffusion facilitator family transporter